MRQEMPDRDARGAGTVELGEVANHRAVEDDFSLVDEQHERRGRGHDLGQRRDIPERAVDADGRTCRAPRQVTVALREQDRVVPADDENRARVDALLNPTKDSAIERGGNSTLHQRENESYDQMPGIRRLQEGQRPSAPMRCCLMRYP